MKNKKSLALCLIAGLLIGSLNGCSTSKNETPASSDVTKPSSDISQPSSGFSLSSFQTADLEGTTVTQDVFKDYDITMVNVWTTWCQYCVEEMPELEKVYRNLPEKSNLITVCMDAEEEEEEAKRLVKETGITFQVLTGNEDLHKIMDKNLSGFPTTFFIDKNGQPIDDPLVGAPSRDTAKTYIDCITAALAAVKEKK